MSTSHPRKPKIHAVDLFCGAGGLTCGLRQAGIKVKAGIDIEKRCEHAYAHNNKTKFIARSVTEITGEDIARFQTNADYTLLAGCAPCQAFSTYNPKATSTDPRWKLLNHFGRLIEESHPDFVTMENVPQIAKKDVFEDFLKLLENCGYYKPDWKVIKCEDYGLPQRRHRLVLLASRLGPIKVLSPEEFGAPRRTVREAIGGLPPVAAGEIYREDPLHQTRNLTPVNLERIRASRPGGSWNDWPEELKLDCHKRQSGSSFTAVYGRMLWDAPSPTMTTQFIGYGSGRFGHPEQDRALTLREGAILQSLPGNYEFVAPGEPLELNVVARMIGNAVPVMIGELIGKSIFAHLRSLEAKKAA